MLTPSAKRTESFTFDVAFSLLWPSGMNRYLKLTPLALLTGCIFVDPPRNPSPSSQELADDAASAAGSGLGPTRSAFTLAVADALFVDLLERRAPSGDLAAFASELEARARAAIQSCPQAEVQRTQPAPGEERIDVTLTGSCPLKPGFSVTGSAKATLKAQPSAPLTEEFDFTATSANLLPLGFRAVGLWDTSDVNSAYTFLTSTGSPGRNEAVALDASGWDGDKQGITLFGSGFNGIRQKLGACYPEMGIWFSEPHESIGASSSLTYGAGTASSGQVQVSVNGITTTEQLPAYGTCPHP